MAGFADGHVVVVHYLRKFARFQPHILPKRPVLHLEAYFRGFHEGFSFVGYRYCRLTAVS